MRMAQKQTRQTRVGTRTARAIMDSRRKQEEEEEEEEEEKQGWETAI